ncbi:MAG: MFS transporter, partial [Pseudomonadota bacterium]
LIVDRTGRRHIVLGVCMTAAALSLALLSVPGAGVPASLLFGLVGMAPAGVIMALAAEAVAPERRAFGMGVFFTVYYAVMTAAPPVAGRLSDAAGTPGPALVFAALLFLTVLPAAWAFGALKARLARTDGRPETAPPDLAKQT